MFFFSEGKGGVIVFLDVTHCEGEKKKTTKVTGKLSLGSNLDFGWTNTCVFLLRRLFPERSDIYL